MYDHDTESSSEGDPRDDDQPFDDLDSFPLSDQDELLIPTEGMKFEGLVEAFAFWKLYACRVGFGPTKRTTRKHTNQDYNSRFGCSRGRTPPRQQKPRQPPPNPKLNGPVIKRRRRATPYTGCNARMIVEDRMLNGTWKAVIVDLHHNHGLEPNSVRFFRSLRELPSFVKAQLHINDMAGVPPRHSFKAMFKHGGGASNCMYSKRDMQNEVAAKRCLKLSKGDGNTLMDFFRDRQSQCPDFYYLCEFDDEHRITSVFWADGRTRASYRHFGDVVTFDTTYLTNTYGMPFAPFVGVNHHGQSMLLGCALLPDERTETYVWLFNTWLAYMHGKAPDAIITDQCAAICSAVAQVMPDTRHRLCLWHILKKLPFKSGKGDAKDILVHRVNLVVYDSSTREDFDDGWADIMTSLHTDFQRKWFSGLFNMRSKWVPAYINDKFWADMSTAQRSEGMNAFFDGFVNSSTSLTVFVEHFDEALLDKWENEEREDWRNRNSDPILVSNLPFEGQVSERYTMRMFYLFQEEVKALMDLRCNLVSSDNGEATYEVAGHWSPRAVLVQVNTVTHAYHCPCHLITFKGLVCKHALCVYRQLGVQTIPDQYFIPRWGKEYVRREAIQPSRPIATGRNVHTFESLYTLAQGKMSNLVEICFRDPGMHDVLIESLDNMAISMKEIIDSIPPPPAPPSRSDADCNKHPSVKNPNSAPRIGRPRSVRLKPLGEKKKIRTKTQQNPPSASRPAKLTAKSQPSKAGMRAGTKGKRPQTSSSKAQVRPCNNESAKSATSVLANGIEINHSVTLEELSSVNLIYAMKDLVGQGTSADDGDAF